MLCHPPPGRPLVLELRPFLAGLADSSRRFVCEPDRRISLVHVLPALASTPERLAPAIPLRDDDLHGASIALLTPAWQQSYTVAVDPLSPAVEADLERLAELDMRRFSCLPFSTRVRQFLEGTRSLSDLAHTNLRRLRERLAPFPALLAAYEARARAADGAGAGLAGTQGVRMSRDAFENGRRAHQPMAQQLPQPTVTVTWCKRFIYGQRKWCGLPVFDGGQWCRRCLQEFEGDHSPWPQDEVTEVQS